MGRRTLLAILIAAALGSWETGEAAELDGRDPFQRVPESGKPEITKSKRKILMKSFALDELRLIGIVGGQDVPMRAMFLNPRGRGVMVARGDHLSKWDGVVTRISPEGVVIRFNEASVGERWVERLIPLDADARGLELDVD